LVLRIQKKINLLRVFISKKLEKAHAKNPSIKLKFMQEDLIDITDCDSQDFFVANDYRFFSIKIIVLIKNQFVFLIEIPLAFSLVHGLANYELLSNYFLERQSHSIYAC